MNHIIAELTETARRHFLDIHGNFYKFASEGSRETLEIWMNTSQEDPVKHSVIYSSVEHQIDDPQILSEVYDSIKFRVLAGILTRPVQWQGEPPSGKICDNQEYDESSGGWKCKVPSNQTQADEWHSKHGHSPACPFHSWPEENNPLERSETEVEKMLYEESKDINEAFQELGLRHRK